VFIASHWTEASNPVVTVFGNCDQVEMYHDGVWVETQAPFSGHPTAGINHPPFYFVDVPAVLGELRAACLVDGAEVATHTVTSPGAPERLTMTATFSALRADGSDLSFVYAQVVDADGVLVPTATSAVQFSVEGGALASPEGVEAEAGVAVAIVRAGEEPGTLRVLATSEALGEVTLELELVEVDDLYSR
jgi:beta-galactosidase